MAWNRRPGTKGQRSSYRGARQPALPTTATENLCESSRPAYTLTSQHKGSRVEGIPPGLCAGPRPRPARGARVHPGGGGVPESFMKAPERLRAQRIGRESPGLQRPPSPRTRRHQDPRQGRRHPGTSQTRSGPSPNHCPSSSLCWLRPEASGPFKNLASEVDPWQNLRPRGEGSFAFLSSSAAFRIRGPPDLLQRNIVIYLRSNTSWTRDFR